jgi:hypothetical protein
MHTAHQAPEVIFANKSTMENKRTSKIEKSIDIGIGKIGICTPYEKKIH